MSGIVLGNTYRDSITGIEGVATAYAEYLNAEPKALLERIGPDGKVVGFARLANGVGRG